MTWRLILQPSAEKQLGRLPRLLQRRIADRLARLEANPRPVGCVKLAGEDRTYRVRLGDYRIVYVLDETRHTFFVTIIAHRREVYRGL